MTMGRRHELLVNLYEIYGQLKEIQEELSQLDYKWVGEPERSFVKLFFKSAIRDVGTLSNLLEPYVKEEE